MKARVNEIAKDWGMQDKKDGSGKYGPAMFVHLVVEDGEEARWVLSWKQVQIGDEIEVVKDGKYWNTVSDKQSKENAKHDEIMNALRALHKEIKATQELLKGNTVSYPDPASNPRLTASKTVVDEVFPVTDEPTNLDEIPF